MIADPCPDHLIRAEVAREMEVEQWHARGDSDSGGSLLYFGATGEAIRNGERVMAVVGRNHVPNQKGAIECYARSGPSALAGP